MSRHTALRKDLEGIYLLIKGALAEKLMDPEEKVRLAVIKAVGTLCESPHGLSQTFLLKVAERCRDKKVSFIVM